MFVVCCLLVGVRCLLFVRRSSWIADCCELCAVASLLLAAFGVCCLLACVRGSLFVVGRSLFVARCSLLTVCCFGVCG